MIAFSVWFLYAFCFAGLAYWGGYLAQRVRKGGHS